MSGDSNGSFGYGFKVKSKKLIKTLDQCLVIDKKTGEDFGHDPRFIDFDILCHGSADYYETKIFIVMKDSIQNVYEFNNPTVFSITKLSKQFSENKKVWDEKLKTAAELLGETYTKGRWYLTTSS